LVLRRDYERGDVFISDDEDADYWVSKIEREAEFLCLRDHFDGGAAGAMDSGRGRCVCLCVGVGVGVIRARCAVRGRGTWALRMLASGETEAGKRGHSCGHSASRG